MFKNETVKIIEISYGNIKKMPNFRQETAFRLGWHNNCTYKLWKCIEGD